MGGVLFVPGDHFGQYFQYLLMLMNVRSRGVKRKMICLAGAAPENGGFKKAETMPMRWSCSASAGAKHKWVLTYGQRKC